MARPALEFFDTRITPWKPVEGSNGKAFEKILSFDPETGSYARLLMSMPDLHDLVNDPKGHKGKTLVHDDFTEELIILEGTLVDPRNNATYLSGYYAFRPLNMEHGPFFHPTGAITFESRTKVK